MRTRFNKIILIKFFDEFSYGKQSLRPFVSTKGHLLNLLNQIFFIINYYKTRVTSGVIQHK